MTNDDRGRRNPAPVRFVYFVCFVVQEFGREESTAATASDGFTLRIGFP